jgi:hypothetical protein
MTRVWFSASRQSPPCSAEVKNVWSCISMSSWCVASLSCRDDTAPFTLFQFRTANFSFDPFWFFVITVLDRKDTHQSERCVILWSCNWWFGTIHICLTFAALFLSDGLLLTPNSRHAPYSAFTRGGIFTSGSRSVFSFITHLADKWYWTPRGNYMKKAEAHHW